VRRARLGRFALYQLQDYVVERGLITLLLVAVTLGPQLYILRDAQGAGWATKPGGETVVRALLADLALPLAFLPVLFAVNGISSDDRRKGYFRFLFSKPVSVPEYYAQQFGVRFAGVMAIALLSMLAFSLATGASFAWGFLGFVAVVFALLGGVGFLLSALVQYDGLVLVLVWIVSYRLLQLHHAHPKSVPQELTFLLPPVDKLEAARDALVGGGAALPAGHLWWMVGYGLACFVLGLVVLARRELAR